MMMMVMMIPPRRSVERRPEEVIKIMELGEVAPEYSPFLIPGGQEATGDCKGGEEGEQGKKKGRRRRRQKQESADISGRENLNRPRRGKKWYQDGSGVDGTREEEGGGSRSSSPDVADFWEDANLWEEPEAFAHHPRHFETFERPYGKGQFTLQFAGKHSLWVSVSWYSYFVY